MSSKPTTTSTRPKRSLPSNEAKAPGHTASVCIGSGRNLIHASESTCYLENDSSNVLNPFPVNSVQIPDAVLIKTEVDEEDVSQSKRQKTGNANAENECGSATTASLTTSRSASSPRKITNKNSAASSTSISSIAIASSSKSKTARHPQQVDNIIPYLYNPATFSRLQELIKDTPPSTTNPLQQNQLPLFKLVLPYLLQRLKMWGGHHFSNENLVDLFDKYLKISNADENKKFPSLTKIDFFNSLVNSVHPLVLKDIFKILTLFPVALPLVVKSRRSTTTAEAITNSQESYKVLIPLLRHSLIKWRRKNDIVQDNFLFSNPFKIVGTLIIGGNSNNNNSISREQLFVQPSQVVNSAILREKLLYAGDDDEPPLTLCGTIEMVPLTEETCSSRFWETVTKTSGGGGQRTYESDEILLLANLYGNAKNPEFEGHFKFLGDLCSAIVVFVVPDNDDDEAEVQKLIDDFKSRLQNVDDPNRIFTIIVSPGGKMRHDRVTSNSICISMGKLSSRQTNKEILDIFQKAVQTPRKNPPNWLTRCHSDPRPEVLKNLCFVEEIRTEESTLLLKEGVSDHHSHDSAAAPLLAYSRKSKLSSDEALQLVKNVYSENYLGKNIQEKIIYRFIRILSQQSEIRQKSISYLESALSQNNGRSLGMEEIFRELSAIYESLVKNGPDDIVEDDDSSQVEPPIENDPFAQKYLTTVPKAVAAYFLEGGPIELFDGDQDQMNCNWLKDIFQHVHQLHPNLKIFVVSMLGIQSSGKSTLLNALFKCRFPVSAGRCTKGLFLQLVFLENDYAQKCKFDAILVIDTEGLESPDNENEKTLLERDRKMATFVASISNLIILNVLGESLRDISRILQIVVIALSSLKNAGLQPSSLMLVQHSNEKNLVNREATFKTFSKSIVAAINLVKSNPAEFGQYNSSTMDSWETSLANTDLVHQFDSFKGSRGGVGAPPTSEYHEDVRSLYEKIMDHGTKTKPYSFDLWQGRIMETYKCINEYSKKDFAFRFKSIVEVQEFYQRAAKVSKVQQKLCQAHKDHLEDLKAELAALLDDPEYIGDSVSPETKSEMEERIYSKINNFFDKCSRQPIDQVVQGYEENAASNFVEVYDDNQQNNGPTSGCLKCMVAVELFNQLQEEVKGSFHESEVLQTVEIYKNRIIQYARNDLESYLEIEQMDRNSADLIRQRIADYLKKILVRVDPITLKECDDVTKRISSLEGRQKHIEKVFKQIKKELAEYEPDVNFKRPIFDDVMMDLEGWINASVITKLEEQNLGEVPPNFLSANSSFLDDIKLKSFSSTSSTITVHPLTKTQKEELLKKLKAIPEEVLQEKNLSISRDHERLPKEEPEKVYERGEGLPHLLKTKVQNLIFNFGNMYDADFDDLSNLKEKALQIFLSKMYQQERKWYKDNSPANIVSEFAGDYEAEMHVILEHGWNVQVAGALCGKLFLRLTKTIAKMRVKKEQAERDQDRISGSSMFKSVENARLAYFTELAKGMLKEDYEPVLRHFREPTKSIKKWTKKKLANFSQKKREESQRQYFHKYFNSLMADIRSTVENATSFLQIRQLTRKLFKQTYSVMRTEIDIDLANFDDSQKRFEDFQIQVLGQFYPDIISDIRDKVKFSSDDTGLLNTSIGCTTHCKFCGAICWLDAGHERNSDDTRFHITSHQPQGLMLFEEVETSELVSSTCYEIHDDTVLIYGLRTRRWRDWKEANPGWLYSRQSNSEFDDLMVWFFVHLNKHLAKQHPDLKPLNRVQFKRFVREKHLPNLNSILHSINIKIRERE